MAGPALPKLLTPPKGGDLKSPASTSTGAQFITHTAPVKGERHASTESGAVYDRRRALRGFHPVGPTTKAPAQREPTLALLRECGPVGASNVELSKKWGLRYVARTFQLRWQGYEIDTRRESENLFRLILRAEPSTRKPLPTYQERTKKIERQIMPLCSGVRDA